MTNFFTGQNSVKFFFEYNDEVIQLPVNPEELTITTSGNNQSQEIISIGEINILKLPNLSQLSISSFFPKDDGYPYVVVKGDKFKTPSELVKFFEKPQISKEPLRLIIIKGFDEESPEQALLLSVEGFENSYKGLDEDTYYKIDFKQYKNYGSKKYATTFKIPQDEAGRLKVFKEFARKAVNKYKQLRKATKGAENAVKTVNNFAQNAVKSLNTIRTTGSIIGTNIK